MDASFLLNSFNAALIIGVAIPSLYMAAKVELPKLRTLTMLLAGFLLVHGLYHLTYALGTLPGLGFLVTPSVLFFGPFGYFLLLAFAVYFARSTG